MSQARVKYLDYRFQDWPLRWRLEDKPSRAAKPAVLRELQKSQPRHSSFTTFIYHYH